MEKGGTVAEWSEVLERENKRKPNDPRFVPNAWATIKTTVKIAKCSKLDGKVATLTLLSFR